MTIENDGRALSRNINKGESTITNWTSTTIRVDIDSAATLTASESKQYKFIKTIKNVTINKQRTKGHIEYTKLYRHRQQIELPFS